MANEDDILKEGVKTMPEAQKFTGLSRSALYKSMDAGRLAYIKVPGMRSRRIPTIALMDFLRAGLVGAAD